MAARRRCLRRIPPDPVRITTREANAVASPVMSDLQAPAFTDVLGARRRIAPYLRPTPLYAYGALSDIVNADVRVKHENHLPIGAFKVRGGVNLVAQLSGDERTRGRDLGLDGQSRPVDRVCLAALRRARDHLRARGRESGEARVDAGARSGDRHARARLRRGARALRAARGRARLSLCPLRRRAAPDRRRRDRDARAARGRAGDRRDHRPRGRRERSSGRVHRRQGSARRHRGDRRPVRFGAGRLPVVAGARAALEDRMETFAEGLATRAAFELPQRIMWDHCSTISCSSPTTRSARRS